MKDRMWSNEVGGGSPATTITAIINPIFEKHFGTKVEGVSPEDDKKLELVTAFYTHFAITSIKKSSLNDKMFDLLVASEIKGNLLDKITEVLIDMGHIKRNDGTRTNTEATRHC
jgi:hypothetical protein